MLILTPAEQIALASSTVYQQIADFWKLLPAGQSYPRDGFLQMRFLQLLVETLNDSLTATVLTPDEIQTLIGATGALGFTAGDLVLGNA